MMARRMAGRLGWGGGLPLGSGLHLFSPPADGSEPQVLEVGEGHAGHQRVSVQAGPGPSLEMPQSEFLLELLMGLLADPAPLDRGGQAAQRCVEPQVAEVVLPLPC